MRYKLLAVLLTLCALWPGVAFAHSQKEGTYPADGAVLAETPTEIGMSFDAPMRITLVTLTRADGSELSLERTDGMQPVTEFRASPETLAPGQYVVEWRGLAEDGHAMQGSFRFEVAP